MQKLSAGRLVHYKRGEAWVAAICVVTPDEGSFEAELHVFPAGGSPGENVVVDTRDQDDGAGANVDSWRWPPRI